MWTSPSSPRGTSAPSSPRTSISTPEAGQPTHASACAPPSPGVGLGSLEDGDRIEHLALAVGDPHHRPEDLAGAGVQRRRQDGRPAEDGLQARIATPFRSRHDLRQNRRRREHLVDLAPLDQRQNDFRVGAVEEHHRGAVVKVGVGHERGAVREWRHQQQAPLGARRDRQGGSQQEIGEPALPLRVDDTFREAGRARGEEDLAPGVERRRREALRIERRLAHVLDAVHGETRPAEQVGVRGARDHVARLRHGKAVLPVGLAETRVEGRLGGARHGHADARPDRGPPVAQEGGDGFARRDACSDEALAEPRGPAEQLGVGGLAASIRDGGAFREAGRQHLQFRRPADRRCRHAAVLWERFIDRLPEPFYGPAP
jgi:hypothetical protein